MLRLMRNMPIFRRMLMVFIFATLLPGLLLVFLGFFSMYAFITREQAARTSFDAQRLAADESANLQRMNALLQAEFYQIFASESQVLPNPSLTTAGSPTDSEIRALAVDFNRDLPFYRDHYELATSANMASVVNILRRSDAQGAQTIIARQARALHTVLGKDGSWAVYQGYQTQLTNRLRALQMATQHDHYLAQTGELAGEYQADYGLLHQATLAFTNLKNSWQQVQQTSVTTGEAVTMTGPEQVWPIFVATASVLLFILLVSILISYIVNQTITRPLRQLTTSTTRINEGSMEARVPINGRDEIAAVATALNGMLKHIECLVRDAQMQRDSLQAQVEKLASEVCNVSEGNLQTRAAITSDALGVLADSFNYMVDELSDLIIRVKMLAREVGSSTTLTYQNMLHLVDSGKLQIQHIGHATQEIESIAEINREVAFHTQRLHIIADQALLTADAGRASLRQTLEGMGRIQNYAQDTSAKVQALGENSREIDNIVGVISTIAQQTNRLALDAAVQAATAGEHGKGFGAVAVDIRRLAERAKEQTNIITRIVRGVSEEIDAAALSMRDTERETAVGVQLAVQTGQALESIFQVVVRQGDEIDVINRMANCQLESSDSVVQIMQQLSEATEQCSTHTSRATRNMESLAHLSEQLLDALEAFKLHEHLNYPPVTSVLQAQTQARRHVPDGRFVAGSVEIVGQPVEEGQAFASSGTGQVNDNTLPGALMHTPSAMLVPIVNRSQPGVSEQSWPVDEPSTGSPGNEPVRDETAGSEHQSSHRQSKFRPMRLLRT